jgi:hypothetical protein
MKYLIVHEKSEFNTNVILILNMLSVFSGIKKHKNFDGQRIVRFSSKK